MHTQTGRVYYINGGGGGTFKTIFLSSLHPSNAVLPVHLILFSSLIELSLFSVETTCGLSTFRSESSPDSYVSTLSCPSPSVNCVRCCVLSVSGFLTPAATKWLLSKVR